MTKLLGIILAVGAILGVGGYVLVSQSYAATPADPLFAVQEIADNVQRALTFDNVAKTELEEKILGRRQEQVERMLEREDITGEQLEEGLELMVQQRERVRERLQEVEQTLEQTEANERAIEAVQEVQNKYDEGLDKQLDTIEKAREKHNGIGEGVREQTVQEATERGRSVTPPVVEGDIGEVTEEDLEAIEEAMENAPIDVDVPTGRGR